MAKGSRIVPIRDRNGLYDKVKAELAKRFDNPLLKPMSVSDFIWKAVEEKLAHMERSRRPRAKKVPKEEWKGVLDGGVSHHG